MMPFKWMIFRLETARVLYESRIRSGATSADTIIAGIQFAQMHLKRSCKIESERLLTKLVKESNQVHGKDHRLSKNAQILLEMAKARYVLTGLAKGETSILCRALKYDANTDTYLARRVEESGEGGEYIVRGPPTSLPNAAILFQKGTPVICHGLKRAQHINGKIGNARAFDPETVRYAVHFEDKTLKPVSVKKENLRVVFELPEL